MGSSKLVGKCNLGAVATSPNADDGNMRANIKQINKELIFSCMQVEGVLELPILNCAPFCGSRIYFGIRRNGCVAYIEGVG